FPSKQHQILLAIQRENFPILNFSNSKMKFRGYQCLPSSTGASSWTDRWECLIFKSGRRITHLTTDLVSTEWMLYRLWMFSVSSARAYPPKKVLNWPYRNWIMQLLES